VRVERFLVESPEGPETPGGSGGDEAAEDRPAGRVRGLACGLPSVRRALQVGAARDQIFLSRWVVVEWEGAGAGRVVEREGKERAGWS